MRRAIGTRKCRRISHAYGGKWPVHCVAGTRGAEFHPALRLPPSALVITKGNESGADGYSAFEGRTAAGTTFGDELSASRRRAPRCRRARHRLLRAGVRPRRAEGRPRSDRAPRCDSRGRRRTRRCGEGGRGHAGRRRAVGRRRRDPDLTHHAHSPRFPRHRVVCRVPALARRARPGAARPQIHAQSRVRNDRRQREDTARGEPVRRRTRVRIRGGPGRGDRGR